MKLIVERLDDSKIVIEEGKEGKEYYIEGVFMQSDIKNRNRRMYPKRVMESQLHAYNDTFVNQGRALGELGHPETPTVNLERVSHNIVQMKYVSENDVYGKAKLLDTPFGNIAKSFVREGIKLGVSTRGLGSLKESGGVNVVQNDFYLAAVDIVADPSAPSAFVNGIMENKEWVLESGILVEKDIEIIKDVINDAARSGRTEEQVINVFQNIISNL